MAAHQSVVVALPRDIEGRLDPAQLTHLSRISRWHFYRSSDLKAPELRPDLYATVGLVLAPTGDIDADLLGRLRSLELVVALGTGVWDYVDVPSLTRQGVFIANVRDYAANAVAEHTLALLFAVLRNVPSADSKVRKGDWSDDDPTQFGELAGLTLGIVGLGSIGSRVAELAGCLGMRVLAHTLHPEHHTDWTVVDLRTLLRQADVVSLHAPWRGGSPLLGRAEIAMMRPGAILVNTARGQLVDEVALADALAAGRLGGAGLDVFSEEPLSAGSPLLHLPRVIFSPHHAAKTEATLRRAVKCALDNLISFLRGQPTNIVNPEAALTRRSTGLSRRVSGPG